MLVNNSSEEIKSFAVEIDREINGLQIEDKDIFIRYDIYDGDTSVEEDGSSYIITGILLYTC
mgnify:CR=1 FL=1